MTDPVLATHGITKSFGAIQASRDISLSLQPGEIHAVIGPNGAGKSTLIAQICGGLAPLPTRQRARIGLARTFQVSALAMEDTVLQNATLGALGARGGPLGLLRNALKDQDLRDKAKSALDRVGLAEHASSVTAELSHGQRRQLEVAVALTLGPRAFIMDEPMAGMGTEGSQRMTAFLGELRQQAPILLVEHDMDAVFALADRLSVLVYGEIIATGTVEEVRNNPQVRAAYLGETA
jgi:branched-chain amino acid transport system ATP-binding protein